MIEFPYSLLMLPMINNVKYRVKLHELTGFPGISIVFWQLEHEDWFLILPGPVPVHTLTT